MIYIFDAYGTLVELDDFYGRLQRALAARGCAFSLDEVTRAARREMGYYMMQAVRARCAITYAQVRRECAEVLRDSLPQHTSALPVENIENALTDAIQFRAFPEVRAVLQQLDARGVPLAVASNWDYALPQHLAELGLAQSFRFILTSASIGVAKPSPAFYVAIGLAVRNAGLEASQVTYIGDHFENDIAAARAAGFRTRWLVRDERDIASGHTPSGNEARIASLQELL